jgi:hypothetical protein
MEKEETLEQALVQLCVKGYLEPCIDDNGQFCFTPTELAMSMHQDLADYVYAS